MATYPRKEKKGQQHAKGGEATLATAVSRVRQPVEALFSWIEEKTGIQQASKVRSYIGIISSCVRSISGRHVFTSLSFFEKRINNKIKKILIGKEDRVQENFKNQSHLFSTRDWN